MRSTHFLCTTCCSPLPQDRLRRIGVPLTRCGPSTGVSHDTLGCDASVVPDARESGHKTEVHATLTEEIRNEGILRAPNSQIHFWLTTCTVDELRRRRRPRERQESCVQAPMKESLLVPFVRLVRESMAIHIGTQPCGTIYALEGKKKGVEDRHVRN